MTNTVTVLAESTGFSAVNTIWVLLGAALVFFIQAGFAMVETGFTRAKNAGNIIMKNLMDFCIGTPLFWLFGFGLMFGDGKFIGAYKGIADSTYASAAPDGVPFFAFLIFQTVFCATAATIVSGAMAERTKFISYCIYSAIISLLVYPIEAHWIWAGRRGHHRRASDRQRPERDGREDRWASVHVHLQKASERLCQSRAGRGGRQAVEGP